MKNNIFIENVKQVKTVGDLKKILEQYSNETELVAENINSITELYIGTTNPIGDREVEKKTLLVFGGSNN